MKKTLLNPFVLTFTLLAICFGVAFYIASAQAVPNTDFTPFSSQIEIGSSGANVTKLQKFLASDASIYPAGIVSGYYGPLTTEAVKQFQLNYGLSPVGRVGPMTLAKMNSINALNMSLDTHSPMISAVNVSGNTGGNATIGFMTDKPSRTSIYYSSSPIVLTEMASQGQVPGISGTQMIANQNNLATSSSVALNGLSTSVPYYYVVYATDALGNTSVFVPANSFTSQ